MKGVKLTISAMGPSIAAQVKAQGCATGMQAELLDRLEHAIHFLRIHGMVTEAESDRAFKRLIKDMQTYKTAPAATPTP
jgi:hypothetical protein